VIRGKENLQLARLAAALVYRNEIIAMGTNKNKTHPFQKKYASNADAIFLHAEIDAICNALRNHKVPQTIRHNVTLF
jgi:deoxycytidylate deaminase